MAGYIIAILVMVGTAATVLQLMTSSRKSNESRVYRELALNVARMGFEEGLSYFRRQPDGVYLSAYPAAAPTTKDWVTPWPSEWPDAAFLPQTADTDNYNQISTTAAGIGSGANAIIRTYPLNAYSSTATSVEAKSSKLWGRFVLRRQSTRNWSPGPNTMSAFTDPEAVHDLTHIRGQGVPGSGNYWSIFSRAYVFAYPSDLTDTAAFEGGSLLNAPKSFYKGKQLLLTSASVYGELYRINFNLPDAAVYLSGTCTVNTNGSLSGQGAHITAYGPAKNSGGNISSGTTLSNVPAPSVAYVFPGLDKASLQTMATDIDPTHVGGLSCFPQYDAVNYADKVSQTSFYYVTTPAAPGNTITFFGTGDTHVMSGVGLVFIDGNLVIEHRNPSNWAGVVFVNGDVTIHGPGSISGILVSTGKVTIGYSSDINKGEVEYNSETVNTVQTFLQDFRVLSSSILSSSK